MKVKLYLMLIVMFILSVNIFAQNYPLVTLQDIQMVPDSLLGTDPPSPYNGDTVRVRGLALVSTVIDPDTNRGVIISAGARWASYIQDPESNLWGGLNIIQNDTSAAAQGTFFDLVDSADIVEFTGIVTEYNTTTELILITAPQPIPVEILESRPNRPAPIELELSDLYTSTGGYNFDIEKYEGMLVIFRNVITSDRVTGTGTSSGNFKINDFNGHSAFVYNQSRYFKSNSSGIIPGYQPPLNGSILDYLIGIVTTRTDGYYIVPVYPGDIGPVLQSPPIVSSIRRDLVEVHSNQPVEVSAKITDLDGTVQEARVYYAVNEGARIPVQMTFSVSDSTYKATIPGVSADSALVNFYIWAKDNQDLVSLTPVDTTKQNYFYLVLNRPLTIKDAQYSPFGGGYSAYNNYRISLTGVVTADSSDIPGFGSTPLRIYMQDGRGPWSGIQIGTSGAMGTQVLNLVRGDKVTVNGVIRESFDVTRIDSLTSITPISSGNTLPDPEVLATSVIGTSGNNAIGKEQWESVLVQYNNVTITSLSADGTSNFGEIYVSDGSGNTRVELEDGHHSYQNGTIPARPILVQLNATFDAIKGVLYYSFSNYKLVPRKNDDFVNYATDVAYENNLPKDFSISQNYPNPFNPSTTIQYALPKEDMVTLRIYNILGQAVKTLVNQNQAAGTYTVTFDASDLTSGIYFYSIQAGNYNQVKKMVLIK
ncbi:MAG: T9SS type A sorting domain-containing protein [Ignavibacterium sp.]|nr:T9SS type A sorting domain-containing protein [Ignavibacterium sp.]